MREILIAGIVHPNSSDSNLRPWLAKALGRAQFRDVGSHMATGNIYSGSILSQPFQRQIAGNLHHSQMQMCLAGHASRISYRSRFH